MVALRFLIVRRSQFDSTDSALQAISSRHTENMDELRSAQALETTKAVEAARVGRCSLKHH